MPATQPAAVVTDIFLRHVPTSNAQIATSVYICSIWWTLSAAAGLLGTVSDFNVILFVVCLPPWLRRERENAQTSSQAIDLKVVQYTIFATVIGCLFIGLAPNTAVLILGGC